MEKQFKDVFKDMHIKIAYKKDIETGELIQYKDDMAFTVMCFIREHFNQETTKQIISGIKYENSLLNDEEFNQDGI